MPFCTPWRLFQLHLLEKMAQLQRHHCTDCRASKELSSFPVCRYSSKRFPSSCKWIDLGGSKGLRGPGRRFSNIWRPETTFSMSKSVGRRTGLERNDAGNRHHGDLEPSLAVSSSSRSDIVRGFFSICPGGKYSKQGNCSSSPKTLTHHDKAPSPSWRSWRDGDKKSRSSSFCLNPHDL